MLALYMFHYKRSDWRASARTNFRNSKFCQKPGPHMQVHSQTYTVGEIANDVFPTVPRALLRSNGTEMAIDYHGQLLRLQENDRVEVRLYTKKPEINKSIYLMQGIMYQIDSSGFECSFGGLLLLYKGLVDDSLSTNMDIFVSVEKL